MHENPLSVACVAMVSSRVLARKLERGEKKWLFFAVVPIFSTNSRGNACYATQATISGMHYSLSNQNKNLF